MADASSAPALTLKDLKPGLVVIFDMLPAGSYMTAQIPYRVEYVGPRDVHFRNLKRGSGTFEPKFALRDASFRRADSPQEADHED